MVRTIGIALLLGGSLVAPFVFYPVFLMQALCFALFAVALNLLLGYLGLLSFGHAAFFGFAAYVTGHAVKEWGLTPEVGILIGTCVAAVMGVVFGWLAIRRRGIYFAMITLALAQMVYFFALQAPFTHGEDGLQPIPRGELFGLLDLSSSLTLYYVVLAIFLFGFLVVYRTVHSPFGQVLEAIRENEPRMVSLGYRVGRYQLLAFTLSATLAGLAGSTKSIVFRLASLTDVHWQTSGEVVLMTLIGGMGTLFGPVVGAVVIVTLKNFLAPFGGWVTVITGSIFVASVLLFRRGIVGEAEAFLTRRRKARGPAKPGTDGAGAGGRPEGT